MIHKFKSPYQIFNSCFGSDKLGGLVKRGTLDQSRFFPNCLPSIFASLRAKVSSVFQTQVEPQKMASGFFNATGFNEKWHWSFGENHQLSLVENQWHPTGGHTSDAVGDLERIGGTWKSGVPRGKLPKWWGRGSCQKGQWYHEQRTLVHTAPSEVKKCCNTYVPTEAETRKGKHCFTHQQWHVRKSTNIPDISDSTPALSSLNQASQELFDDVLNQEFKWSFDFKNNNKKHGKDDSDDSKIQPHHQAFPETPGVIEASAPQKNR